MSCISRGLRHAFTIGGLLLACGLSVAQTVPQPKGSAGKLVEVKGIVVSAKGELQRRVWGACAASLNEPAPAQWYASDDGRFTAMMQPGSYWFWAFGAKAKAVRVAVPQGANSVSTKVIGRTNNELKVRLEMSRGKPLARVYVTFADSSQGWTDGRGRLSLHSKRDAPYHNLAFVRRVGYAKLDIATDDELFADRRFLMRLHGGKMLPGKVLSDSGIPLGGVVIFPVRKAIDKDPWSSWNDFLGVDPIADYTVGDQIASVSRDGDGGFSLGPLPPGDYGIRFVFVADFSFIDVAKVDAHIVEGRPIKPLQVRARMPNPMYEIKGRALDAKSKAPLAYQILRVAVGHPPDTPAGVEHPFIHEPVCRNVRTDGKGNFRLYPLSPGAYRFDVSLEGDDGRYSGQRVTVPSSGKRLDFLLEKL